MIYILNRVHIHSSFSPQLRRTWAQLEQGDAVEWRVHVRGPRLLWPQRARGPRDWGHQTQRGRGVQVQGGLQVGAHQEHPGQCHPPGWVVNNVTFVSQSIPLSPELRLRLTKFPIINLSDVLFAKMLNWFPEPNPRQCGVPIHVSLIINEFTLVHATVEFSFTAKSFDSKLTWDCTLHTICHSK